MAVAEVLSRVAAELALFAGVGFLLFAINDVLVDLIYFARRIWRAIAVYTRYPRAFASELPAAEDPGFLALLVPAWDEASIIASMLRATLQRVDYSNYRIFVGYYSNDPATAAAIVSVHDPRIEVVEVEASGPTTKPIASTISTTPCSPTRWRPTGRPRRSCSTTPRMSSTRLSSSCSTG
jgi:adsorption protein B